MTVKPLRTLTRISPIQGNTSVPDPRALAVRHIATTSTHIAMRDVPTMVATMATVVTVPTLLAVVVRASPLVVPMVAVAVTGRL